MPPSACQTRKLTWMSPAMSAARRHASSADARSPGWALAHGAAPTGELPEACTSAAKAALAAVTRPSWPASKRPTGTVGSNSLMSAIPLSRGLPGDYRQHLRAAVGTRHHSRRKRDRFDPGGHFGRVAPVLEPGFLAKIVHRDLVRVGGATWGARTGVAQVTAAIERF